MIAPDIAIEFNKPQEAEQCDTENEEKRRFGCRPIPSSSAIPGPELLGIYIITIV